MIFTIYGGNDIVAKIAKMPGRKASCSG